MPTIISTPTRITAAGNKPKIIEEYIGRANSGEVRLSIAHMRSPGGWVEPGQTPEFEPPARAENSLVRHTFALIALVVSSESIRDA